MDVIDTLALSRLTTLKMRFFYGMVLMLASAVCTARTEAQASEQSEVDRPGNNGKHFPSIFFYSFTLQQQRGQN